MFKNIQTVLASICLLIPGTAVSDIIDGEEFLDPTRPLFQVSTGENDDVVSTLIRNVIPSSYDLSFIRAGSNSPMAVINSERVSIGDVVGGATVVAIERSSVTLSVNGEERVVSLYSNSIKAPVTQ